MVDGNLPYKALCFKMANGDVIFSVFFYEVLQNIPKTVLGWKYIVLLIGMFVLLQKMHRIIYLQGKRWPPILDIMIIGVRIL